jgi:regulator of extracellular matrix RemA (YlzA/DUF370 family)
MSSFHKPYSSADREASNFNRQTKRKNKSKIDASTEIIPDFWFPGDEQTPKNQELLEKLTRQPIEPGMGKHFAGCGALNGNVYDAEILEVTPVRMPGGALSFLEVRWRAPDDEEGKKRFTHPFRAYDCHKNHMNDVTSERQPFLCDRWSHFWEGDQECDKPGLLLPLNADKLKTACDAATQARKARSVAWLLCEGAHSLRGVERRLNDPAVAHIVEKWKRDNGIDHIVVGAWIGGMAGAQHTNFGMLAHHKKQIVGQNDWPVDFSDKGPIGRVVVVPDHDNDGYNEKEMVAKRLQQDFGCSQEKIFETRFPEGAREHWDDDNELPTDVTQEMRVDQLLNSKQWKPPQFVLDERNKFVLVPNNIDIKMGHLFDVLEPLYFDEFRGCVMLREPLTPEYTRGDYPRRLTDDDVADIANLIRRTLGGQFVKTSEAQVREALKTYTRKHSHNPVREYLDGLTWDGGMRVDTVIIDYLGADATESNCEVGRVLLLSLVARAYEPGCKADQSAVLIGPQRFKKSTFLRKIAGDEYFSDCLPELGGGNKIKEAMAHLKGRWLVEISEAASILRAEVTRLKSFITTQVDIFRHPFGHLDGEHPRQGIFAITANDNSMFRDDTGARRFLPVDIGVKFRPTNEHMALLDENRDQLLAEAVYRIKAGENHFTNDEDESRLLEPQQEAHRDIQMWEEEFISAISEALEGENVVVSAKSLRRYFMAMSGPFKRLVQPREYNRVLINHGWARRSRRIKIKDENGNVISTKCAVNCWGLREADGAMARVAYGRMLVYHSESPTEPGRWMVEESHKEFDAEFDAATCRAARGA